MPTTHRLGKPSAGQPAVTQPLMIKIATFNVHGLVSTTKRNDLIKDMSRYGVEICCLQETKVSGETVDEILSCDGRDKRDRFRLILIPGDCRHYGQGFIISERLWPNFIDYKKINDRIAKATFRLNKDQTLVLINIYAPTQARSSANEQEREDMYDQLTIELGSLDSNRTTFVLAGDFNSKIGKSPNQTSESCIGKYTRGRRNENGQRLIEFCEEHGLVIADSLFRHRANHLTTWEGSRKQEDDTIVPIYNQIDYIITSSRMKSRITAARSWSGTNTNSDHRLLIATMTMIGENKQKHRYKPTPKFDTHKLAVDEKARLEYQAKYDELRPHITTTTTTTATKRLNTV